MRHLKMKKNMGVTELVSPLEAAEKRRTFSNFPICEDIKYHYYLIYTPFRRKNGGEFNEALFRFFHFVFNVLEGTGDNIIHRDMYL